MVKAEEKFARVTVACIGEAAVRPAGGRRQDLWHQPTTP